MLKLHWQRRLLTALVALVLMAAAVPVRAQTAPPASDEILALIATSDGHFKAGQNELEQGHVEAAKAEFNLALEVLLASSYGGRTEPRIRDHFDRLVDRISTYEVRALATGDGFTEKKYEPASIDELLALSTMFGTPPAPAELKNTVASDLLGAKHDIPIPLNQRVLSYIDL